MGGKSDTNYTPNVSPETANAMLKEAELANAAQDWYENEMYPWVKTQTEQANALSEEDSKKAQENYQFWRDYYTNQNDVYTGMSDQLYNHYKENYQPYEDALLQQANNFNEDAYAQRQLGYSMADNAYDYGNQRESLKLQMANAGYDPTSGAYQARMSKLNDSLASANANAANNAALAADSMGWNKKLYGVGQGQGYIQNALNTANTATNAAGTYGGLMSNSLNNANSYSQNALGTITNLAQLGINNYSALSNAWGSYANAAVGNDVSNINAQSGGIASTANNTANAIGAAGTLIGGLGAYYANNASTTPQTGGETKTQK